MTSPIVEVAPTNKAHTTEHKSISDFSFYGIVNQIQKELSDGWEINNQEYPIYTGTLFTVAFKRVKGLAATLAPPSSAKAPVRASTAANGVVKTPAKAVKAPSTRRKATVSAKVVVKEPLFKTEERVLSYKED